MSSAATGAPASAPQPNPSEKEFSGLVRRGVGWTMASSSSTVLMALLTSVAIAHFMTPRSVGLANEAVVFVTLTLTLGDMGVGAVIVQREQLSEVEISSLFWAGVGVGAGLTLLGVSISPLIAGLYGEPRVGGLFAALSLTFLVTGPGIVQAAILSRELRFRSLELRTIIAIVTSCTTAIVLAALGAGPWAIVVQTIVMAAMSTALVWRASPWRPMRRFSASVLREFRAYASHILGARLVGWANSNLDNLIVGRFLGAGALGAYSLAFAVALIPVNRIAAPITAVFFPAFSQIRDPEAIAAVWLRATRILAFVAVPVLAGLIVSAPELVRVVFGDRWRNAAPVMQLLAGVGMWQTLTALNDAILQAVAQTRLLLRVRTAVSVLTLVGFGVGTFWGIDGAAAGYLITCAILHPVYVQLTARAIGSSLKMWLQSVVGVSLAGGVMAVVLLAADHIYAANGVPAVVRLLTLIVIGALVYSALILVFVPSIVEEIQQVVRRRRGQGDAA